MSLAQQSLPVYRNTQPGTLLRFILLAALIAFLLFGSATNGWVVSVAAILMVALACFHSLTTEVYADSIVIWFGVGLIRRTIMLSKVQSCSVARTPWYVGWGIRLMPGGGWLWNVSGLESVELQYVEGDRFRVGSNRPQDLAAAISEAIGAMERN